VNHPDPENSGAQAQRPASGPIEAHASRFRAHAAAHDLPVFRFEPAATS
jgi:hypothetical protein